MGNKNQKEYEILSLEKNIRKDRAKGITTVVLSTVLASALYGTSIKEGCNQNYYESVVTFLGSLCILFGGSTKAVQYGTRAEENKQQLKKIMQ